MEPLGIWMLVQLTILVIIKTNALTFNKTSYFPGSGILLSEYNGLRGATGNLYSLGLLGLVF